MYNRVIAVPSEEDFDGEIYAEALDMFVGAAEGLAEASRCLHGLTLSLSLALVSKSPRKLNVLLGKPQTFVAAACFSKLVLCMAHGIYPTDADIAKETTLSCASYFRAGLSTASSKLPNLLW